MKDAVSVDFGPLTFSLRIEEEFREIDGRTAAQGDSGWQPGADPTKWPTFEILPKTPWNFGLPRKPKFEVIRRPWPANDVPWTLEGSPLEMQTTAYQIPSWRLDSFGLVAILPKSPVKVETPPQPIRLIPMGAARLRISAFPQAEPVR
jgi:hypothetical protein